MNQEKFYFRKEANVKNTVCVEFGKTAIYNRENVDETLNHLEGTLHDIHSEYSMTGKVGKFWVIELLIPDKDTLFKLYIPHINYLFKEILFRLAEEEYISPTMPVFIEPTFEKVRGKDIVAGVRVFTDGIERAKVVAQTPTGHIIRTSSGTMHMVNPEADKILECYKNIILGRLKHPQWQKIVTAKT